MITTNLWLVCSRWLQSDRWVTYNLSDKYRNIEIDQYSWIYSRTCRYRSVCSNRNTPPIWCLKERERERNSDSYSTSKWYNGYSLRAAGNPNFLHISLALWQDQPSSQNPTQRLLLQYKARPSLLGPIPYGLNSFTAPFVQEPVTSPVIVKIIIIIILII